jgi:hypothetical protein
MTPSLNSKRSMQRKTEPPVTISGVVALRETAKGLLCSWGGSEHWVAKSQISTGSEVRKPGDRGALRIPAWFSRKIAADRESSEANTEIITVADQHGQAVVSFMQAPGTDASLVCPICGAEDGVRLQRAYDDENGAVVSLRCDSSGHHFDLVFSPSENSTRIAMREMGDVDGGGDDDGGQF